MWKLEPGERIACWRTFRKKLDLLTLDQAIDQVIEFWQGCPFEAYYLDSADPTSWPDPWQLISENYYCDLAKSLGMLYTLYFTVHGKDLAAEIRIYRDPETQHDYNLVVLDHGKYVLNLVNGSVVNIESVGNALKLQTRYSNTDLRLQEY
jgi:hypothetical protein